MAERKSIPVATERLLWGVSAGRCEFEGCNKPLYKHDVTETTGNYAEKAHIHAVSPGGSRHEGLEIDVNNFRNLMLVCAVCHKTIDDNESDYSPERLFVMKQRHEERVKSVTAIEVSRKSTMLFYTANTASSHFSISEDKARIALIASGRYPTENSPVDLSLTGSFTEDNEESFYTLNAHNLLTAFEKRVLPNIENNTHISVFAFAPQPLLVYLGSILTDKYAIEVFQRQGRNSDSWQWGDKYSAVDYIIEKPENKGPNVAVLFALSSKIDKNRIYSTLGDDTAIYTLTIDIPNRDFVTHSAVSDAFVAKSRVLIDMIKSERGKLDKLHIFPVMPISLAIRFGMDYMPKTDPPLLIYDEIRDKGFVPSLTIGGTYENTRT